MAAENAPAVIRSNNKLYVHDSLFKGNTSNNAILNTTGLIKDSVFEDNIISGSVISSEGGNIWADEGDVIFKNNRKYDSVSYNQNEKTATPSGNYNYIDISGLTVLNLNASEGHKIEFNGSVIGQGNSYFIIGGSNSNVFMGYDSNYNEIKGTIDSTGGQYIFNNLVQGFGLRLYDNAQVKLGSVEQADETTTYGKLDLNWLAVNGSEGAMIDMQNGYINSNTLGTVDLKSNLNLTIDADLSQTDETKMVDSIHGTSGNVGSNHIVISAINVLADPTTAVGMIDAIVATGTIKDIIQLSSDRIRVVNPETNKSYIVSYVNTDDAGYIHFLLGKLYSAVHTTGDRQFNMEEDEENQIDLGEMEGTRLTINGASETGVAYEIHGNGTSGFSIADGQETIVNDVKDVTGFDGAFITNNGILTINALHNNSKFSDSIVNNSELNLNAAEDKTLTMLTITGDENSSTIIGGTYEDEEGVEHTYSGRVELGTITQNSLEIASGTVSVDADNLSITEGVDNNSVLELGGGTLSTEIYSSGESGQVLLKGDLLLNTSIGNNLLNVYNNKLTIGATSGAEILASGFITSGSELDSQNGNIDLISFGELTLNGTLTSKIDVDLDSAVGDEFNATSVNETDNKINISDINLSGDSSYRHTYITVGNDVLSESIETEISSVQSDSGINYSVSYSDTNLIFSNSNVTSLVSVVRDGYSNEYVLTDDESIAYGIET